MVKNCIKKGKEIDHRHTSPGQYGYRERLILVKISNGFVERVGCVFVYGVHARSTINNYYEDRSEVLIEAVSCVE